MWLWLLILSLEAGNGLVFGLKESSDPLTETKSGWLKGIRIKSQTGKELAVYFNIPYALPPINHLRFRLPVAVERWDGILNADTQPLPCHQVSPTLGNETDKIVEGFSVPKPHSEDCLKLNVYVPFPKPEKAPVLFYIHGGGFYGGSSVHMFTNGSNIVAEEGLIFVSVNYRLGPLGFLALGNDEAPGNVGIWDQRLALQWVRENIPYFGGDPSAITLVGASSGAASVGYHALSGRSLFRRAVLVGGTPLNPWAVNDKEVVFQKSMKIAENLGYVGGENVSLVLSFLRSKTADELISANELGNLFYEPYLGPISDGVLIPFNVEEEARKIDNFNFLISTTSDEMGFNLLSSYGQMFQKNEDGSINESDYRKIVADMNPAVYNERVVSVLTNVYKEDQPESAWLYNRMASLTTSDYSFTCPADRFADILTEKNNRVYRYIYDATPKMFSDMMPKWMGAAHASDPLAFMGAFLNTADQDFDDFSFYLMKIYANFARTGDPSEASWNWPSYDRENRATPILREGKKKCTGTSLRYQPNAERCSFWRHLLPLAIKTRQCQPI